MSNKTLAMLCVVAVCMVIWAVVQSHISGMPRTEPGGPTYLIQGLDPEDIGGIVVGTGEGVATLQRRGRRFVVADKDGYPADTKEINELISTCLGIKAGEVFTDNPANHEELGVTEEKASHIVKLLKRDPNAPLLAGIIVGKRKEVGEGTFVRLLPGDKVYVSPEVPWIKNGALDYIDKELISVDRKDIESVTVTLPDDEYRLTAKDGKDIVLLNVPEGKKAKSNECERVLTCLTSLTFDDVRNRALDTGDLTFDKQHVCRLKDSTVYTVRIAEKDNRAYATCEADFTDEIAPPKGDEPEEALKEKEAKLLARDRAKAFTAKHQAWIYEIPNWKAKNLTKKVADLVEDEKKPEEKAEEKDDKKPEEQPAKSGEERTEAKKGYEPAGKVEEPGKVTEPNEVEP